MDWRRDADLELAGEQDAARLLDLAETLLILGEHDPSVNVIGAPHTDGTAWLRVTETGLAVLAIAPDAIDTYRIVTISHLYGEAWPSSWVTKGRLRRAKARAEHPGYEAGWACGMREDKTVQACRVVRFDGDKLFSVLVSDDVPAMAPSDYGFVRWWSIGQMAEGLERLWERGKAGAHNYGLLCLYAKASKPKAEKLNLPGSQSRPNLDSSEQSRRAKKAWETRRRNMAAKAGKGEM